MRGIYKYIEFFLLMNSTAAAFPQTALILCLAVIVATAGIMMLPTENVRAKMKRCSKCQHTLVPFSGYYIFLDILYIGICIYMYLYLYTISGYFIHTHTYIYFSMIK